MAYATETAIELLIGDIVVGRAITDSTVPTTAQVATIIAQIDSTLDMALAARGYTAPIASGSDAYNTIVRAANAGVAADLLAAFFPHMAFASGGGPTGRYSHYRKVYEDVLTLINKGGFRTSQTSQISSGSVLDDEGDDKDPLFKRGMMDYPGARSLTS